MLPIYHRLIQRAQARQAGQLAISFALRAAEIEIPPEGRGAHGGTGPPVRADLPRRGGPSAEGPRPLLPGRSLSLSLGRESEARTSGATGVIPERGPAQRILWPLSFDQESGDPGVGRLSDKFSNRYTTHGTIKNHPGDSAGTKIERSVALQQGAGKARKEQRTTLRYEGAFLTDKKPPNRDSGSGVFGWGYSAARKGASSLRAGRG